MEECLRAKSHPQKLVLESETNFVLSAVEESLIARALPLMTVVRLKSQQMAFRGNVISFRQNINELANELPTTYPVFLKSVV